jgi:predicted enzyme related to lactoylglutathione lyase
VQKISEGRNQIMKYKTLLAALLLVVASACTTASRPDLTGMSFSSDPLLGKVIWHDLISEDLTSSRAFYEGMFGWTFEASTGTRGEEYLLARSGDVLVAGLIAYKAPDDDNKYSRWLPYISVDDVDAAVSRASAAGAKTVASARDVSIGRVAAIVDPQGAVIGLARSSIGDPDDTTTAPAPGRPIWTELLADDPAVAATFYRTLAGYNVDITRRRGGEYIFLANDGVNRAGIFKNPTDEDYMPVWLTTFGVADPDAAAAKAESLGGKIILPASPELRDGTTAVITDPTGAILVLRAWNATGEES